MALAIHFGVVLQDDRPLIHPSSSTSFLGSAGELSNYGPCYNGVIEVVTSQNSKVQKFKDYKYFSKALCCCITEVCVIQINAL